jgi:hypothetical protein
MEERKQREEATRAFDEALRERLSANRVTPRLKALMERSRQEEEQEPKSEESS